MTKYIPMNLQLFADPTPADPQGGTPEPTPVPAPAPAPAPKDTTAAFASALLDAIQTATAPPCGGAGWNYERGLARAEMSQAKADAACGIPRRTWEDWEREERRPPTFSR